MGQSPPGESYNSEGLGMPFLQGKAEFGDRYPTPSKWCDAPTRLAEAGDILLSVRAPVGPINFAKENCCIGRGLAAIRANKSLLDQSYLYYVFRFIEPSISSKGQGSTFSAINKSDIEKISFPLPSLSEQRKIVEILDQADALRTKRAESDRLSDRILPALFIKMFGDPIINPMRWPTKNLEEITDIKNIRNGISPSHKGTYSEKVLTLSAITQGKFNANAHKVAGFSKKPSKHKLVRKNDFLVCRGNGNINLVGQGKFPNNDYDDLYFPDTIIAVPIDYSICQREYLETIWSHEVVRQQIETLARTTNGTYKINQSSLLSMKILLPPPDLQEKFCLDTHKLHQVLALQSITVSKIEKLFQTLLHQAFTGTLTASWRTAHMTELLQEMEHQAKQLNLDLSPTP